VKRLLVLFDIDGTILLSGGAGRRAILSALADETGVREASLDHIRFDGKTDPQIALELLAAAGAAGPIGEELVASLIARYLVHLESDLTVNAARVTVMPGMLELLNLVEADQRAVLGLLTGNVSAGAALKLKAASIEPTRFRVGAYGSDHADRAELPPIAARRAEPLFGRVPAGREVVIIGDTPADVTCGRSIGAVSIGVATGSYTPAELRAAGAHAAFQDFSDPLRVHDTLLALAG